MIAEIPAPPTEQIYSQIVSGSLWFLSVVTTAWVSFRYGLRSQTHAALLAARNKVYQAIERIVSGMDSNTDCWNPHSKIRRELRAVTVDFYSLLSAGDRARIKKALDDYHALYCGAWQWPKKGTPEREKHDREIIAQVEGLERLRHEISDT